MRSFFQLALILLLPALFAACSSNTKQWSRADTVELLDKLPSGKDGQCKFVDTVIGSSENNNNDSLDLHNRAMERAKFLAASKGATHIIVHGLPHMDFDSNLNVYRYLLVVNAYYCTMRAE